MSLHDIVHSLNEKQKAAVTSPGKGPLQVVAGPGTGKTKVLVARVAYLLLHEHIPPSHIIVTTFTKKAANEMVERLSSLLQGTNISIKRLLIGTFHSICYRILQKFGGLIHLKGYTIADEKDSRQILHDVLLSRMSLSDWDIVDSLPEEQIAQFKEKSASEKTSQSKYHNLDPKKLARHISSLKSSAVTAEAYNTDTKGNPLLKLVYKHYQDSLQRNRLFDFDDCLLYCHLLLSRFPVLDYIQHTLVDEFQDTNDIQLLLMYQFSGPSGNVTVVGDPDQSIYAFRDAQVVNFTKMRQQYLLNNLEPVVITLDDNYRSTSDILDISESIMRQQSSRMLKNLKSHQLLSMKSIHSCLGSADLEAKWIVSHIALLTKLPGLFSHSDIAILVRSAFQTRVLEHTLTRSQIPYLILKGRAFWERKEVVAIMDYIRCVASEDDRLAYLRCMNYPKRGLGPKALQEIDSYIEKQTLMPNGPTVFAVLNEIASGTISTSLGPKNRSALSQFLSVVTENRCLLPTDVCTESDFPKLLDVFFEKLFKLSGLENEFKDDVNCGLNVREVKNQLLDYDIPEEDPFLEETANTTQEHLLGTDFLSKFVASVRLFETNPESKDESSQPKVTISTIHGAKGLEWPVVFVPGASEGLIPASFAIDEEKPETIDEERRCFYVAITRAKSLLFISSYTETGEGKWGRKPIERKSRYLKNLDALFQSKLALDGDKRLLRLYALAGKVYQESMLDELDTLMSLYERSLLQCFPDNKEPQSKLGEFVNEGFSSARTLNGNSTLSCKRKQMTFTAPRPQKAPVYVAQRTVVQSKASEKRAPTYIPQRAPTKRRLGTR